MSEQFDLFSEKRKFHIAITGSSGFVGSYLRNFLEKKGHIIIPVPRRALLNVKELKTILSSVDVVINLCGENIGKGLWSKAKKRRIYDSRILSTRNIVQALNSETISPKIFISTSAIGIYGIDAGIVEDEQGAQGTDFLAAVCVDWEREAKQYTKGKLVIPRFGVVFSKSGGMFKRLLNLANFGFLGKVGAGIQKISFITLEDLARGLLFCIEQKTFSREINLCTPNPISNKDLTKCIGRKLQRLTIFPIPAFLVKLLLGEKGESLLLADQSVFPKKLEDMSFSFRFPRVEDYL